MGTGILIQLLTNFPYPAQWIIHVGYAFWVSVTEYVMPTWRSLRSRTWLTDAADLEHLLVFVVLYPAHHPLRLVSHSHKENHR